MSTNQREESRYSLAQDPVFYVTVWFFAILTAAMPAGLGQPVFLPIVQTVSLTVFLGVAFRSRKPRPPLLVMASWIALQYTTITVLSVVFGGQVERAIIDGFAYRTSLLSWFFAGEVLPRGWPATPWSHLLELAGVSLGSLATGGLIGNWFLVRAVNLAGYTTGTLFVVAETPRQLLFALPIWQIVRIAGLALLVVFFAEPMAIGVWYPMWSARGRRKLMVLGGALVLFAIALEILLSPYWNARNL